MIPEILNAIDMIFLICKFICMINSVMMKLTYIKCIITVVVIGVYNAVRPYFTCYFSY